MPDTDDVPLQHASPPLADFPPTPRATLHFRVIRRVVRGAVRLMFRVHVVGRENVPAGEPVEIVSNHQSWLDPILVLCWLPPQPRIHAFGDFTEVPHRAVDFVRWVGGLIPVDRRHHGDEALREHTKRVLEAGGSVLIYPEGRYGLGEGEMREFHKGFAHFAIGARRRLLPVGVSGTHRL